MNKKYFIQAMGIRFYYHKNSIHYNMTRHNKKMNSYWKI